MKISYDKIRGHYRLTDYTPVIGSRLIYASTSLGEVLAKMDELQRPSNVPQQPASEPDVGQDEPDIDFDVL